jgi:hypothetical protein
LKEATPVVESDRRREDDWFLKNEQKMLEGAREAREKREKERAAQEAEGERKRLRELHFMKCPKCGHDMKTEKVEGIDVDRCSFCEGLYLDAGELEQLFTRKIDDRKSFLRKLIGI